MVVVALVWLWCMCCGYDLLSSETGVPWLSALWKHCVACACCGINALVRSMSCGSKFWHCQTNHILTGIVVSNREHVPLPSESVNEKLYLVSCVWLCAIAIFCVLQSDGCGLCYINVHWLCSMRAVTVNYTLYPRLVYHECGITCCYCGLYFVL